jgi:4-phytase/acid phosphatase
MKRLLLSLAVLCAASALPAAAAQNQKSIFAVVVTRHGIRSISRAPAEYSWADWQPVPSSFLTARGYHLMTYTGQYYRLYFASLGIPLACGEPNVYVYADTDQRTLATGQALIEGMCGKPASMPMYHNADVSGKADDPLFDATQWALLNHRIDAHASQAAVLATLPSPPSKIVAAHRAEFDALQGLLNSRCPGTCTPVTTGESTVSQTKDGLSELSGPVKTASSYAEDLFLEYAQCRPETSTGLEQEMRLHVLAYDVNARNKYNPRVRGGTLFAHIVAMLEEKAGRSHGDVAIPDIGKDSVVFFSGHDTQLGALGGILDAHWSPGNGIAADDMPPGAALVFELYRAANAQYRVRLRYVTDTAEQFRHYNLLPAGIQNVSVRFPGCSGDDCSIPLDRLSEISSDLLRDGLVRKEWTNANDDAVTLDPLVNPKWTQCSLEGRSS